MADKVGQSIPELRVYVKRPVVAMFQPNFRTSGCALGGSKNLARAGT